jgi:peptidyl-prolyl cis-trans isomerase SurA
MGRRRWPSNHARGRRPGIPAGADASQTLSDDEILTAKLSLLNDLILQDILLAKARTLKLEVAPSDLDTAYADARKNMPDEAFQQELTRRSMTPADMREGLRRELLTQKVIAQEVGSKIAVTDQEVTAAFNANRAQFNMAEESYHLAQIVVTPARDGQVANTTGDDAKTPQEAAAKAQMLIERLKGGASFRDLAMGYSEDPESAPRGGDLGFVPVSKLKQAPQALRDAVLNKEPGSINVASMGGAYTLVLVVAHEQAGQRDLATPGVRERITETLRARKDHAACGLPHRCARRHGRGQLPGAPPCRVRHPAEPSTCCTRRAQVEPTAPGRSIRQGFAP